MVRLMRCDTCYCLLLPEDTLAHDYHVHEVASDRARHAAENAFMDRASE